jgi:hypothetical protein
MVYGQDTRGWIPDKGKVFLFSTVSQTGFGAHPISYPTDTENSFCG